MILTNCAACAAPLAHDAPRCVRCKLRYCNSTCQHDHWRRGHKQMCKKIHRGGNAEQYNADKKYKEAVAVAVEACADDTKGQKCYICLEAVHSRTGEGLVRGCACGDREGVSSPELGVAHVSSPRRAAPARMSCDSPWGLVSSAKSLAGGTRVALSGTGTGKRVCPMKSGSTGAAELWYPMTTTEVSAEPSTRG